MSRSPPQIVSCLFLAPAALSPHPQPQILPSLWHAGWLVDTEPDHKTLFFPPLRPFLSPLSLLLAFYPSICLTPSLSPLLLFRFNLQQGLSGTAAGLPHHFSLPPRGFAAVSSSGHLHRTSSLFCKAVWMINNSFI